MATSSLSLIILVIDLACCIMPVNVVAGDGSMDRLLQAIRPSSRLVLIKTSIDIF